RYESDDFALAAAQAGDLGGSLSGGCFVEAAQEVQCAVHLAAGAELSQRFEGQPRFLPRTTDPSEGLQDERKVLPRQSSLEGCTGLLVEVDGIFVGST